MELEGIIIRVLPIQSGTSQRNSNVWYSQEYIIETLDRYPRKVCFRIFGEDKIKQANIQQGDSLRVQIEIDASEWNGRWFNRVNALSVEKKGSSFVLKQDDNANLYPRVPINDSIEPFPSDSNVDLDQLPF